MVTQFCDSFIHSLKNQVFMKKMKETAQSKLLLLVLL